MSVMQTLINKFGNSRNAELYARIIREIQNAEMLWVAFSENSNNYFVGSEKGRAAAYLFSEKKFFEQYYVHMQGLGKNVTSVENPVKYRMALFADLYRCGYNCVVIDNGQHNMTIDLFDIIKEPARQEENKETRFIVNPELVRTANWIFQENERDRIDARLWQILFSEIFKAEYIIPIDASQLKIKNMKGRNIKVTRDSKVSFPVLENSEGKKYYPFFTDWNEYRKYDMKTQYSIMAAGFNDMKSFLGKADGIVINPFGINVIIDEEMLETIAKVSEDVVKDSSKIAIGDPKMYPLEMVRKISETLWDKEYIKAAYLKLMLRNREESYLVALEGELPDKPERLYDEISKNALPDAGNIPIDFIDYSSDFAKKVFGDSEPFYSAK